VKGRFWFSANGDRDVVAYTYTDIDGSVPYKRAVPRWPGGPAVIEWTPRIAGEQFLEVWPEDAAGNRGPMTRYRFTVRDTAPGGSVDVAGVGLPSRLTLTGVPEVTQFGYQLPGQAEVRFPAVNGAGSTNVTFPAVGSYEITTRSYVRNRMIGSGRLFVYVDDAPTVSSAEFQLDRSPVAGQPGTFTFAPRSAGVVAYLYSFGGAEQRIEAPGGTAVLPFTPPSGGWYTLYVRSVRADGSTSSPATHYFNVIDPHPTVYVYDVNNYPRTDGPGSRLQVDLRSGLPTATGFAYRFNGGAEQTVTAEGGGTSVFVTPDHAGPGNAQDGRRLHVAGPPHDHRVHAHDPGRERRRRVERADVDDQHVDVTGAEAEARLPGPGEQLRHGGVEEGVHLVEAVLVGGVVLAAGDDGLGFGRP